MVAFLTPRDWAAHVQWEGTLGQALRLRGADVHVITCGGGLEVCDRANTWEAPPMPCTTCTRYVEGSVDAHGFPRLSLRDGWEPGDAPWPELDALERDDLLEVEDDGLALGELVDIPTKWFLMAAQLDDDPLAPADHPRVPPLGPSHRPGRGRRARPHRSPTWWCCATGSSSSRRSPGRCAGSGASTWSPTSGG